VWAAGAEDKAGILPLSYFTGSGWEQLEALAIPGEDLPYRNASEGGQAVAVPLELDISSLLPGPFSEHMVLGLKEGVVMEWKPQEGWSWAFIGEADALAATADVRIRALLFDKEGVAWAAGSEQGLWHSNNWRDWSRVDMTSEPMPVRSVVLLDDGSLWAAGDGMVARSHDGGLSWDVSSNPPGLGDDIGALVQDDQGRLWAGAYVGGVSILEGDQLFGWQPLQ
jgi:hypothetical protein